jgi:hypothetical protein
MTGWTNSNTGAAIATGASHQPLNAGGAFDAFLVKFDGCDVPPAQPAAINGPTLACAGTNTFYTTPVTFGATSYTLFIPGNGTGIGTAAGIPVTFISSGVFTLVAGNACGVSPQQTLNVTVNPAPTVVVNSGSICAGQSFTIVASGANTYTYSGGTVVSPIVTSAYQVTGSNAFGCTNMAVSTITVHALPTISAGSGAICTGQTYTITASGAATYTYSGGPIVSPAVTSSYSVTGTSSAGCVGSNTAVSTVTVNPLPAITASATSTVICSGESAILTAGGGATYTFNPGGAGSSITVSPTTTSTYTVTGTDANGCNNTATVIQKVDACTGVKENKITNAGIKLYPNPTNGIINLEVDSDTEMIIINSIGQVVYVSQFSAGHHQINLEHLAKGIYVVKPGKASSTGLKMIME